MNTTNATTTAIGGLGAEEEDGFNPLIQAGYKMKLEHYFNNPDVNTKAVYIIRRVTGILSMLGSLYILQDIILRRGGGGGADKLRRMSNKIMIGLSIMDIMYSFCGPVLGTIPVPAGQAYGSYGTISSCSAIGFFVGIGFTCSTMYNASLACCYLGMVKFKCTEQFFHKWYMMFWFLFFPPLYTSAWGIGSSIAGANYFNGMTCSLMVPYPMGCDEELVQCERGEYFKNHFFQHSPWRNTAFTIHLTLICVPIVIGCMLSLFCSVLATEQANDRYVFDSSTSNNNNNNNNRTGAGAGAGDARARISSITSNMRRSRGNRTRSTQVGIQGIFYVMACLAVQIPTIFYFAYVYAMGKHPPTALNIICAIFMPLQGFLNHIQQKQKNRQRQRQSGQQPTKQSSTLTKATTTLSSTSATNVMTSVSFRMSEKALIVVQDDENQDEDIVEPSKEKNNEGEELEEQQQEEEEENHHTATIPSAAAGQEEEMQQSLPPTAVEI